MLRGPGAALRWRWEWEAVAGTHADAQYDTREEAERAVDSLVETCGWDRGRLRIVEVKK